MPGKWKRFLHSYPHRRDFLEPCSTRDSRGKREVLDCDLDLDVYRPALLRNNVIDKHETANYPSRCIATIGEVAVLTQRCGVNGLNCKSRQERKENWRWVWRGHIVRKTLVAHSSGVVT